MATIYAASWLVQSTALPPLAGGAILVRDGIIAACGRADELKKTYQATVIEYPGFTIMPGFVNAHTHLELTHFPAWRLRSGMQYNPRRFVDWLLQMIKIKRGVKDEEIPSSVREGIRMCLESGTTAVGEIVTNPVSAASHRSSPLAGRLFFELLGHDPRRFGSMLDSALTACRASSASRLTPGLSPHAPYTIGEQHLATIRSAAADNNLPLAIHISESAAETDFIFNTSGPLAEEFYPFVGWQQHLPAPHRCSPTALLDRSGLLTTGTLAVHCVHLTLADAEILKSRGVTVALCPRSNEMLDVGRAPVALLRKLGIPLALGTDSLASNNSLSMWDEMRFALDTFRKELSPADLFTMATATGARALGIALTHGSLETGKQADFQIVACPGRLTNGEKLLEGLLNEGNPDDVFVLGERFGASTS